MMSYKLLQHGGAMLAGLSMNQLYTIDAYSAGKKDIDVLCPSHVLQVCFHFFCHTDG